MDPTKKDDAYLSIPSNNYPFSSNFNGNIYNRHFSLDKTLPFKMVFKIFRPFLIVVMSVFASIYKFNIK
jgi:hypothetical protein